MRTNAKMSMSAGDSLEIDEGDLVVTAHDDGSYTITGKKVLAKVRTGVTAKRRVLKGNVFHREPLGAIGTFVPEGGSPPEHLILCPEYTRTSVREYDPDAVLWELEAEPLHSYRHDPHCGFFPSTGGFTFRNDTREKVEFVVTKPASRF